MSEDGSFEEFFKISSIIVISIMLICNTVISIKTLPEANRSINYRGVVYFSCFMCFIWEFTLIFRIYINYQQVALKIEESKVFKIVMITYFTFCELVVFTTLVLEIIHQTYVLRKKYIAKQCCITPSLNLTAESPIDNRKESTQCLLESQEHMGVRVLKNVQPITSPRATHPMF